MYLPISEIPFPIIIWHMLMGNGILLMGRCILPKETHEMPKGTHEMIMIKVQRLQAQDVPYASKVVMLSFNSPLASAALTLLM